MAELMGAPPGLQDLNLNLKRRCFRRGPMYSAYAELREWKLRVKNKKLPIPPRPPSSIPTPSSSSSSSSSTKRSVASTPMVSRSVQDLSMAFRKENRQPPSTTRRQDFTAPFCRTPPPVTPKREAKRGTSNARGSATGVFSIRKSSNCLQELKEYSRAARLIGD